MGNFLELSVLSVCVFFIGNFQFAQSIDEKHAYEQPCFKVGKNVEIDLKMFEQRSYYALMSRLELYRISQDLLQDQDPSEVMESSLYYDSCIYWETDFSSSTPDNSSCVANGFGGHKRSYRGIPPNETKNDNDHETESDEESTKCRIEPVEGTGLNGTVTLTLTDNSTFIFTTTCMADNQMTFSVSSPLKRLPQEKMEIVRNHAISLGFKKEYFVEMRYDHCALPDDDRIIETTTAMNDVE